MNRGSHWQARQKDLAGEASMRPRFMNRGSRAGWYTVRVYATLQ